MTSGNHDLRWQKAKDPVVEMLHKWAVKAHVCEGFWNEPRVADGRVMGAESWNEFKAMIANAAHQRPARTA